MKYETDINVGDVIWRTSDKCIKSAEVTEIAINQVEKKEPIIQYKLVDNCSYYWLNRHEIYKSPSELLEIVSAKIMRKAISDIRTLEKHVSEELKRIETENKENKQP